MSIIKTPQDYLSEINYSLQTNLGIKDTKLLSSGALSALANMLSNIAFDAQKYYEYVTKEFNVATAQNFKSMLFHASVYSYDIKLAIPASVTAYLMIPKTTIANDRMIKYIIPSFSTFELNNSIFRIEGQITVEITENGARAALTDTTGIYELLIYESFDENNNPAYYIAIPDSKIHQVERYIDKFVVPQYEIGDNVSFNITIPEDQQIYIMKVYVNSADNPPINTIELENIPLDSITKLHPELEEFEIKFFKFNTNSLDKVIFANLYDYQNITFTLGNGIYGYKLQTNDEVITVVEYSNGEAGNVPPGISQVENVYYYEINTSTNDTIVSNVLNIGIKTETPASGGLDASSIEDIRFGILQKITERNSLITQLDFEKYFADPITKKLATVISRQIDTMSPVVTIYNILRNPYDYEIIKTTTENIAADSCFSDTQSWCIYPSIQIDDITLISPFVYIKLENKISAYYLYKNKDVPLTINTIIAEPEIKPTVKFIWDNDINQFKITISGLESGYEFQIDTNYGNYKLNDSNDFEEYLNDSKLVYERFPLDAVNITRAELYDSNGSLIHKYNVVSVITLMKFMQNHKNYIIDDEEKILFIPFVNENYVNNLSDHKYEDNLLNYFRVAEDNLRSKLAFNIAINQGFFNTIDANDQVVIDSVRINENDQLLAKYPIDVTIKYDANMLNVKGVTLLNLKTDIRLALLEIFKNAEGDKIEYYTTEVIETVKNMYPDIIKEVIIDSPHSLVTNGWVRQIELSSYPAYTQLSSKPTFFYFDVNNMNIKFIIA